MSDPLGVIARIRRALRGKPQIGKVDFGQLRALSPISRHFGYDRGLPIDRYYIERFLAARSDAVQGRVLEVGDANYTRTFGGDRVTSSDVLHVREGNPAATLIADLVSADHLASSAFDCIILTQTLQFVFDHQAAIATLHRLLVPGGVLLLTVPGISNVPADEWGARCCWSYTALSVKRLLEQPFDVENITVEAHGSVLSAIAFLHGLSTAELDESELAHTDPGYQLLITATARKALHGD